MARSSNHSFIDGNKRTAFLAMGLFLEKNGHSRAAGPVEAAMTMLKAAAAEMDIGGPATWLRANTLAAYRLRTGRGELSGFVAAAHRWR